MKRKQKNVKRYLLQHLAITFSIALPLFAIVLSIIPSRSYQLGGDMISRVSTVKKVVALTFDDGPETPHSDEVLKILRDHEVKATFFLIGIEMQRFPDATQRLATSGNEIGNHSYTHQSLVFLTQNTIGREIERTDALIRKAGYLGPIPFRPPYGHKFVELPYYLERHDRKMIMWDIAPDENGERSTEKIVEDVFSAVQPGSIIILHAMYDHNGNSRQALPSLISGLKSRGYQFVTVSELLKY